MENYFREGNYADASKIQYDSIPDLEKKIDELTLSLENSQFVKLEVQTNDIAEVVSKWTGFRSKNAGREKEKLLHLESVFRNRVIGQEDALKKTADVDSHVKIGHFRYRKTHWFISFHGKNRCWKN